ncbi:MAG TPA: hypothetical protein VE288_11510 [Rubrobacteraceae bacterium]|nr:hypothetical protein [Rubrobacteraceae bacterium]
MANLWSTRLTNADGSLVDYKANMDLSEEIAEMTAQFSATVTMMSHS